MGLLSTGGVIITGAGAHWSAIRAPDPPGTTPTNTDLSGVSCTAVGDCVAVGYWADQGPISGLIETETGGAWAASTAPAPPGGMARGLQAVACSTLDACVASGGSSLLDDRGGVWTASTIPVPSDADINSQALVQSVACAAASCVGVGSYYATGIQKPLVVTESGGAWSATTLSLPSGVLSGALRRVSCGRTTCAAIGSSPFGAGPSVPLVASG